ncbi:tRNAHis guanylyltransferase Thg1 [Penicillium expansum]|uniref:tRNA(His) guanylyltransferase n=1 Tax=Penicillium expansum TaxID=27334 RepID=A0A0A2I8H5_PENEN|nr:tRNAHis guanylyltransferase Thg1 [Penicillium expansum]KGO39422.1 tRNAHis guanylyltransferase Thg1 [Penicillium expansum]KGO55846.1 tRNAHis guanylyltransferase Thg1 [Penicillium expansum]
MANSRFEYVKSFEQPDVLLPNTWIVVRIDGRGFHKLSDHYAFAKPNDRRALDLMNAAAVEVMKELPDLCIAYGVSDEFSTPSVLSSILAVNFLSGAMEQPLTGLISSRKLVTTIVSTFTAHYIYKWSEYFPERPLLPPYLPSFDGRAVIYPNNRILRDYMSWRQVDCHINNLYNTTFWTMVLQGGMSNTDAEQELKGTVSADKNEILFKRFGINYNNELEIYKKGTVLYRQYELEEPKPRKSSTEEESSVVESKQSRSQQDKIRKLRRKAQVVIDHVDIIKDEFWEKRPWILSGNPGKLPA